MRVWMKINTRQPLWMLAAVLRARHGPSIGRWTGRGGPEQVRAGEAGDVGLGDVAAVVVGVGEVYAVHVHGERVVVRGEHQLDPGHRGGALGAAADSGELVVEGERHRFSFRPTPGSRRGSSACSASARITVPGVGAATAR